MTVMHRNGEISNFYTVIAHEITKQHHDILTLCLVAIPLRAGGHRVLEKGSPRVKDQEEDGPADEAEGCSWPAGHGLRLSRQEIISQDQNRPG